MTLLAVDWSSILVKAGQFILSFSILVVLHELGHFLPARWFKCRVEKFYLFFNPWFSLFKTKKGETEYGIGWIPFGGYVKISGMIDESMDKEQMKLPPQPHEFRSKKAWQRLIIMLGGIVVNVLLAIIIFIGIMWYWGEEYIPNQNVKYGVYADSLARKIGIESGDKIISIDGKKVDNFNTIGSEIALSDAKKIQVSRKDSTFELSIPEGFINDLNKSRLLGFIEPRVPYFVDSVSSLAKVISGSLMKGDQVIGVRDSAIQYLDEYFDLKKGLTNVPLHITLLRNNKDTIQTSVELNEAGIIGIQSKPITEILGTTVKKYNFIESISAGTKKCFSTLNKYVTSLGQLFKGKVKAQDSLGSVFSIANTFAGVWDWQSFWTLTAIFSIILAFMNLLPIPGLDGGHALFTLVEMVTGRKPSDKFMEYAQTVGMIFLLGLMAYALGLDVWRWFK